MLVDKGNLMHSLYKTKLLCICSPCAHERFGKSFDPFEGSQIDSMCACFFVVIVSCTSTQPKYIGHILFEMLQSAHEDLKCHLRVIGFITSVRYMDIFCFV